MSWLDEAKLDEALNLRFKLSKNIFFTTRKVENSGYFIMLENELGNFLAAEDIKNIIAKFNDQLFEDRGACYYISDINAEQLINTINYIPVKILTALALKTVAENINQEYNLCKGGSSIVAHCAKNKLYVPCYELDLEKVKERLQTEYNLEYITKTSSGWKAISYLIFKPFDPENLYTLLRMQGKLKDNIIVGYK